MMTYYWDKRNRSHLELVPNKNGSFELEISNQCFFNCYYISFQDMQSFLDFMVPVINHSHINGLHLFWNSFEWFCLLIRNDIRYFFLSCPRHCDQGLIVAIVYYFQIWNKKENNIIISRVISSHMGPMYIEIPYKTMYNETPYITIYIETPYITMYTETPYIIMYTETHCCN